MTDDLSAESLARWSMALALPHPIGLVAETDSTNEALKRLAAEDAPHGTALVAESQTAGKGRLGRSWVSAPGVGLWLSVLLRPDLAPADVPLVGLGAALATARACGEGYRIKWPNDVLGPADQKVAGVLSEMETQGRALRFVVVGIGVNVRAAPSEVPAAGALTTIDGLPRDRSELAARITRGILDEARRVSVAPQGIIRDWSERSHTLGRQVRVGDLSGVASGIDPDGALRITDSLGQTHRVLSGDLTW